VSEYDTDLNNLFILLPTYAELAPDKTSNLIELSSEKEKKLVNQLSIFSKDGKFIKKIGRHGSHSEDGFLSLYDLNLIENELQLVGNKLIAFDKNDFAFRYYIDSSCPEEPSVKLNVKLCKKNKCFGEQPYGFLTNHFNSAFVAELKEDPEYPEVKLISELTEFYDIEKYKDSILGNYQRYTKKDVSIMVKSYVGVLWSESVYVISNFVIREDNSYFVVNGFGTELFHYNNYDVKLDSIFFEQISKIRKSEIEFFHLNHDPKIKINHFSHLENLFLDENNDNIYFYYSTSMKINDEFSSPRLLFVYSFKTKKTILELTPIDFYPITYDENKDLLVGLKIVDQRIKIQYYKIKQ